MAGDWQKSRELAFTEIDRLKELWDAGYIIHVHTFEYPPLPIPNPPPRDRPGMLTVNGKAIEVLQWEPE